MTFASVERGMQASCEPFRGRRHRDARQCSETRSRCRICSGCPLLRHSPAIRSEAAQANPFLVGRTLLPAPCTTLGKGRVGAVFLVDEGLASRRGVYRRCLRVRRLHRQRDPVSSWLHCRAIYRCWRLPCPFDPIAGRGQEKGGSAKRAARIAPSRCSGFLGDFTLKTAWFM